MFLKDPLRPADVGLILSYRCQCACAHCLYNCGPNWQDWMSPQDVRAALEATLTWSHSYQVHMTGGEAFLNFDLLLYAVETAAELGIARYVETNAGWCVSDDLTSRQFKALRTAGLQAILISCSPFHAETIPLARTHRALHLAEEIFGASRVMFYQAGWAAQIAAFSEENPVPLQSYSDAYGQQEAGQMLWQGYGLIPGGRSGYRLGDLIPAQAAAAFRNQNCALDILYAPHSHLDLYGNFISGFCGGLAAGSWRDLPALLEDFDREAYPPLTGILIEDGPYGLYELANRHYGYVPRLPGYAGKCHLCVDVRRHLTSQADFSDSNELQPAQFYDSI
jgi:hypothetical protein